MILSGKALREQFISELHSDSNLNQLNFFLYGRKDDLPCLSYLKGIKRSLDIFKIPYQEAFFDETLPKEENLRVFQEGSRNAYTILARPLHSSYEAEFVARINPLYDPDMMTIENIGHLYSGDLDYLPATAQSCRYLIGAYQLNLKGRKVLIVGRSLTVGKPLWQLASYYDAFVAVAHSKTDEKTLNKFASSADYIFFASGKSGLIKRNSIHPETIIIDCGFSPDGGDLGFVPEEGEVKAYTPVPGGVGALTSLCLIKNALMLSHKKQR